MRTGFAVYIKFVMLAATGIILIFTDNTALHVLFLLVIIIFTALAGSIRILRQRVSFFLLLGVVILISNMISQGNTAVGIRLYRGLQYLMKLISVSMAVLLFTQTTPPVELVKLASFLPRQLRTILTISFAFIPVIQKEYGNIMLVQTAKGMSRNKNIFRRFFPVIIPLMHRIMRRSENLAMVLESRGYTP